MSYSVLLLGTRSSFLVPYQVIKWNLPWAGMYHPSKTGSLVNFRKCSMASHSAFRWICLNRGVTGMNTHWWSHIMLKSWHSLAATVLNSRISSCLKSLSPSVSTAIPRNIVYVHPTIERLACYLSRVVIRQKQSDEKERCKKLDTMIARYSIGPSIGPSVVLLTGSTGHLGCLLLASLTKNPTVHRIYALNRPKNLSAEERHRERFRAAGFDFDDLKSNKIRFIVGDLSARNLGLSKELYNEVWDSQFYLCVFLIH